jgi:predicted dehydrogenase
MKDPHAVQSTKSRRRFLKTSAAAVPAAALTSLSVPRVFAAGSDVIRIGVIGCGNRGPDAARNAMNADKGVRLVAMADILMERIVEAREMLKKLKPDQVTVDDDHCFTGFDAYKKLIECVDVVLIANAAKFHPLHMIAAIQAGKHVFVEKPLAVNSEQLAVITEQLLVTDNCLLMTGFNRRFAPLAQQLYSSLFTFHEPKHIHYRVNAGYIPLNHWTQDPAIGGGRIIGEGCHFIDFITFLVGESPVSVTAHALPDGGKYREDNVSMTFTFPDGSIGVVDYLANGDKSFPKERVEVFCGGQVSVLDDFVSLQTVRDGRKNMAKGAQDKGHVAEWKAFATSIREGGEPPIPYEQLIGVTKSAFAAVESICGNGVQVGV